MYIIKEGQKINGKYQIIEKIGEGATSRVYLAYDLVSETNVSLKILKHENIDEKKIRNFKREAKAVAMLNDPNIIKIYEINEINNMHYIAQEYVEGMTLKDYILKTPNIEPEEAQRIVLQILKGLEHAHQKGVVHKDIKSQNILLSINNEVKITDFGIADILEDDMTKTQSLMGTPQYVAPEVLNKGESTHQTDIYSTGILLYELLIGHAPFTGEKPTIIIMKQLNQPLPSVKKQKEDIPQSLENVLLKATAKKLENRYKTAQDMIDDLSTVFDVSRINEPKVDIEDDFDYDEIATANLNEIKELNEEEEKKEKRKKSNRRIIIILLIVFLFIVINFTIFAIYRKDKMPDLTNKTLQEAKQVLINKGIKEQNINIEYSYDKNIEEGHISQTEPKSGRKINKDTVVTLTISRGTTSVVLKNYVGQNINDVQEELEELGFTVEVFFEQSDIPKGKVLSQQPEAGEEVSTQKVISLIVSEGMKKVAVKDLVGLTELEAESWISDHNLNLSKSFKCSEEPKDIIYEQSPAPNTKVDEDTLIKITISTGECQEPIYVPQPEETEESDEQLPPEEQYQDDTTSPDEVLEG